MGLLLNHLGVDGKGRLVFDAGDATVGDDEEEIDPRDEEMVDLADLKRTSCLLPISPCPDHQNTSQRRESSKDSISLILSHHSSSLPIRMICPISPRLWV